MELVRPSEKYKQSFIDAVKEYIDSPMQNIRSRRYAALPVEDLQNDFQAYIKKITDAEKGIGLPEGYVPQSEWWLADGDEYIGSINVRHQLTEHLLHEGGHIGYDIRPRERGKGYGTLMLKLVLPEAKRLGISKALITCDSTNDASRKIIEKNGGLFENEVVAKDGVSKKRRYWITT